MELRVRPTTDAGVIVARAIPLDHLLITATTSGTAQTLATVRTGVMLKILQLAVTNVTGTAATLSLNSIPNGGSIGDGNAEVKGYSVAANSAVDLTPLVGGLYKAGAVLKAYSGTGSTLVIHGWAEEIL
jgi:hypothetical protein